MDTRTNQQRRTDFLDKLKVLQPDMKVHYINQQTKDIWASEKTLKELTPEELEQVNLRKSRNSECIFDVEDQSQVPIIKEKLQLRQWNFTHWYTGSRGVHFSVVFDNLAQQPIEVRNRIRRYLIKEIGTDEALAKESQFVALEWSPHFKTGVEKTQFDAWEDECNNNNVEQKIIDYCTKEIELEATEQIKVQSNVIDDESFKDFYKTDPYLLYALQTKIESGDRNNILFKNLGIGLAKSGLGKSDIEKIADRIVKNCLGKTKNEFMGWVEKALLGELRDYNKSEMIQWAAKYGHPIYYDLIGTEDIDRLLSIKMLWDIIWNHRIAKQPMWKDLCFYNMLGTVVDERIEDYRVHIIFSSFSGTGKDEGLNLVKEVLDKLDVKTNKPASVTDRTLLGAVNQYAVEANTKHGVDEHTLENGKHRYKNPIELGLLAESQWVAFGESESVFQPGAHNKQIQLILRQAMDKARYVEKGVGGHMIKLNTNTTFAFVTYNMDDTIYKLLNNGLFQRALYYNKIITDEDNDGILDHIITKRFNKQINENYDEQKYINLLIEKLKHMKLWYIENKHLSLFEENDKYMKYLIKDYLKQNDVLMYADKQIMNSIMRRGCNNIYKLSVLTAVSQLRSQITKEHIDAGFSLIEQCIDSVQHMIVSQNKSKKQMIGLLMILRDGEKTVMNTQEEMKEKLGIHSATTLTALIKKVVDLGYVIRQEQGKYTYLSLTQAGKEELGED